MTHLGVTRSEFQAENRSWLRGPHGTEPGANPNVTLIVSLFDADDHYPNGYIPSGIVLGKVTANGTYGPYDPAATDGREEAAGLLFGSLSVIPGIDRLGGATVRHGFVDPAKLPIQSGTGALDADARAALSLIDFE